MRVNLRDPRVPMEEVEVEVPLLKRQVMHLSQEEEELSVEVNKQHKAHNWIIFLMNLKSLDKVLHSE